MVDADKGYALLTNVIVPVEMLPELARLGCSADYDYKDGEYRWRPKSDGIGSVSLISGAQLVANQIAYRLEKDNKK